MSEDRFRVWCTSWGETEDDGMDVVACEETKVVRGEIRVAFYNLEHPGDAALEYARYAHDHRDGYECTWPLAFRVRSPDGDVTDFSVERDFEPSFRVSRR